MNFRGHFHNSQRKLCFQQGGPTKGLLRIWYVKVLWNSNDSTPLLDILYYRREKRYNLEFLQHLHQISIFRFGILWNIKIQMRNSEVWDPVLGAESWGADSRKVGNSNISAGWCFIYFHPFVLCEDRDREPGRGGGVFVSTRAVNEPSRSFTVPGESS